MAGWFSLSVGSNHYGIAGYYTLKAVEQGMIVCGKEFSTESDVAVFLHFRECVSLTHLLK